MEENTCQRCSRGHRFALQYWEDKRLQTRDRCPVPECCSRDFTADPTPFVGWSGRLLDDVLAEAGLPREKAFVGNVSQVTQTADELADPSNPHVAAGLAALRADLTAFRPNVVLCLGNTALRAFHHDAKASVTNWRGSLFASTFLNSHRDAIGPLPSALPGSLQPGVASPPFDGASPSCGTAAAAPEGSSLPPADGSTPSGATPATVGGSTYVRTVVPGPPLKCVASYHPAAVLRTPGWTALLRKDVERAVTEAATPRLNLPVRRFLYPVGETLVQFTA